MTTAEFIKKVGFHALGWGETAEATYDLARLTLERGIPGDFVECGVYAGASSALMARAILDWDHLYDECKPSSAIGKYEAKTRRVHLFDSFEGMPAAEPVDKECFAVHGEKTGMAKVPLDQVKGLLKRFELPEELFVFHRGWFEDTIPYAAHHAGHIDNIAVLRLDGDLYKSTKLPMQELYPLVSVGGWVIVDDFHLTGCKKAIQETAPRIFAGDNIVNPGPVYWRKTP